MRTSNRISLIVLTEDGNRYASASTARVSVHQVLPSPMCSKGYHWPHPEVAGFGFQHRHLWLAGQAASQSPLRFACHQAVIVPSTKAELICYDSVL